jgi:ABC-type phosphate/phosphonate transport system substrate-binding protein
LSSRFLLLLFYFTTENNDDIVLGVLDGRWDVGFVRTGHIERTIDPRTGRIIDPSKFKTLEPRIHIMDNGELFPFLHSTPTFPEWPFFARQGMDPIVAEEVQNALHNLGAHKKVGDAIYDCIHRNETSSAEKEVCYTAPPAYFVEDARCDTTREIAEIARRAGVAGRHSGFRPPKSHFHLRTMQEAAGFLQKNDLGT